MCTRAWMCVYIYICIYVYIYKKCWNHQDVLLWPQTTTTTTTTPPDTHQSFSDATLFAYTAVCTYMYVIIWCTTKHDNKTHVPYDYTSNDRFTANNCERPIPTCS